MSRRSIRTTIPHSPNGDEGWNNEARTPEKEFMINKPGTKLNVFHMDFNYVSLRLEYVRDWLLQLKGLGFNAILWELEDKVQWETCPECVWPEALTKKEFRELLDYSRLLGMEPIPLLQTVGHGEYVLMHERYRPFRELDGHHDCYCVSNPGVTRFLGAWVEEYLELFGDIRHFHLGGDEAYVFAKCPKCSAHAAKQGRNTLFGNHIRALAEPVLKKNIRPGIWNDMIIKDPEDLGFDRKRYVIWDWNYWDTDKTPEKVNLHGLGCFSRERLQHSGILKEFPELADNTGRPRPFGSVQILKKLGFDVVLCSASRSDGDSFSCPAPFHAGNIAGAAKTAATENLLGHCVTSWAIRMNDYTSQIPYIGLATYARTRAEKSSEELFSGYCRTLFGADPGKFIKATSMLGAGMAPFTSGVTVSGVQWNTLKDSLPPPKGHLKKYLADLENRDPARLRAFPGAIRKSISDITEGINLLSEFLAEAKSGFDIIEAWLAGARFLMSTALAGDRIMREGGGLEMATVLEHEKKAYDAFLRRHENPLSAAKNAGLVYDASIDFFRNREESRPSLSWLNALPVGNEKQTQNI